MRTMAWIGVAVVAAVAAAPWPATAAESFEAAEPGPLAELTVFVPVFTAAGDTAEERAHWRETTRTMVGFYGSTPNYAFGDRLNQFDVRLIKNIKFRGYRLRGMFDAYNLFNASTILRERQPYGSTWRQPTAILGARTLKFGVQLDY